MHLSKAVNKFKSGRVVSFFRKEQIQRKGLIGAAFLILCVVFLSKYMTRPVAFQVDEVADKAIRSPITAVVVDEMETSRLRQQAADAVQKSYKEDPEAFNAAEQVIKDFFDKVSTIALEGGDEAGIQISQLISDMNDTAGEGQLDERNITNLGKFLLELSASDRQELKANAVYMLSLTMDKPITTDTLGQVRIEYSDKVKNSGLGVNEQLILTLIGQAALRFNLIYDSAATEQAKEEARQQVEPVQKTIKTGETIVREGERVTPDKIAILKQLGLQRDESSIPQVVGVVFFLLFTGYVTLTILAKYRPNIYGNNKLLALILLIILLVLVISRFVMAIKISDRPEINNLVAYLAPVASGAMLIAILLDNRLAYFMTVIMAIYIGILAEGDRLFFTTIAFVSGVVGIYRTYKFTQTSDLAKSGLYIALANMTLIFALGMLGDNSWQVLFIAVLLGVVSGILSTILTISALPFLESLFSITSVLKLLELSNPNTNILKRLLLEAPGTYHHSLMVGNLAEATAESIKANPLLVRVGAYYHDIGKIRRPEYYVENQRGLQNQHEKIAPELSAMIIIAHVRDGIEIAKKEHLPADIINFIATHHGNSLTKYFYNQALEANKGKVNEYDFRYEGPRPSTKETALVMLADSVEAAVRSLKEPTVENIRKMVHTIIKEKLADGQLDNSELTLRDLDIIEDKFCSLLEGVYHKRIAYPQ